MTTPDRTIKYPAAETSVEKSRVPVRSSAETVAKYEVNEDAFINDPERGLFAVFDGLGGEGYGDYASNLSREYIIEQAERLDGLDDPEKVAAELSAIIVETNERYAEDAKVHPEHKGMGSTASVAKLVRTPEGSIKLVVAHVGDSRVYKIDSAGNLDQITVDDDSLNNSRVDRDKAEHLRWKLDTKSAANMTAEELHIFSRRNEVGNSLGHLYKQPSTNIVDVWPGDRVLITSDGIHDNLRASEIENVIAVNRGVDQLSAELMARTRERIKENTVRSKPDDLTIIAVDIHGKMDQGPRLDFEFKKHAVRELMQEAEIAFRQFSTNNFDNLSRVGNESLSWLKSAFPGLEFQQEIQQLEKQLGWLAEEAKDLERLGDTPKQRQATRKLGRQLASAANNAFIDVREDINDGRKAEAQVTLDSFNDPTKNKVGFLNPDWIRAEFAEAKPEAVERAVELFAKLKEEVRQEFKAKFEGGPPVEKARQVERKEVKLKKKIEEAVDAQMEADMIKMGMTDEERAVEKTLKFNIRMRQEQIDALLEKFKGR